MFELEIPQILQYWALAALVVAVIVILINVFSKQEREARRLRRYRKKGLERGHYFLGTFVERGGAVYAISLTSEWDTKKLSYRIDLFPSHSKKKARAEIHVLTETITLELGKDRQIQYPLSWIDFAIVEAVQYVRLVTWSPK